MRGEYFMLPPYDPPSVCPVPLYTHSVDGCTVCPRPNAIGRGVAYRFATRYLVREDLKQGQSSIHWCRRMYVSRTRLVANDHLFITHIVDDLRGRDTEKRKE